MAFRSSLLALSLLALAAACSDSPSGPGGGPNLPLTGTFSGTTVAGNTVSAGFVAGRSGATIVKVCGRAGTNFDIAVGASSAATASNCERLEFTAAEGQSYTVDITAVTGGGPYNGCWSTALAECTVSAPPSVAATCDVPAYFDPATGKTGLELLHALRDIVSTNRDLGYLTTPNARDSLYAFVDDPDGDDLITDIYTGRTATVNSRSTAFTAGFNTEHAWPESRGADIDLAAGTDLNILFTSDTMANRIRSNHPYGVVTTVQWTAGSGAEVSRAGLDAQNRQVFEPRPSKRGDVARAVFYFYARYHDDPAVIGFSLANFNVEEATLLQWAADDPPDQFERARNDMVCRAQGNRNPFIDHPEYLNAIGDFPNG
jgi:endonuclease I